MSKIKIIILFLSILFLPTSSHAGWMPDFAGNAFGVTMDHMLQTIKDASVAALKQEAAQTINQTVSNVISQGTGTGAMFITNWENFLINQPQRKTELYMNDFFSNLSRGRNPIDYSRNLNLFGSANGNQKVAGASTMREGVVKGDYTTTNNTLPKGWTWTNYDKTLEQGARNITTDASVPLCPQSDFSGMFDSKTWADTNMFFSIDTCNQFGYNNEATSEFLSLTSQHEMINAVQGIAGQGYKSATLGDTVITPASTIAAIQAQTEDIGNKIIASAKSIPEVITALVTRMTVRTIQQGIGQAGSYARREINSKTSNYSQQIRSSVDPRQIFKPSY